MNHDCIQKQTIERIYETIDELRVFVQNYRDEFLVNLNDNEFKFDSGIDSIQKNMLKCLK